MLTWMRVAEPRSVPVKFLSQQLQVQLVSNIVIPKDRCVNGRPRAGGRAVSGLSFTHAPHRAGGDVGASDEVKLREHLGIPVGARHVLILAESSHWDPDWLYTWDEYFRGYARGNLDQASTNWSAIRAASTRSNVCSFCRCTGRPAPSGGPRSAS